MFITAITITMNEQHDDEWTNKQKHVNWMKVLYN